MKDPDEFNMFCDSVALIPVDDSSAWPRKNATNDVMNEITSATAANTAAFAA